MLLAFYPDVSAAALARARQERPDYFAGGTLGGSHGDKLFLPDGQIWDLIFAVDGGGIPRWQAIQASSGGGGGDDDRFPLEPGALVPLDEAQWPVPAPVPIFEPLVAGALIELGGAAGVLDSAQVGIGEHSSPLPLEQDFGVLVGGAAGGLDEQLRVLHLSDLGDVVGATNGTGAGISGNQADYTEPVPPELPSVTPDESLPGLPPGGDVPPEWP